MTAIVVEAIDKGCQARAKRKTEMQKQKGALAKQAKLTGKPQKSEGSDDDGDDDGTMTRTRTRIRRRKRTPNEMQRNEPCERPERRRKKSKNNKKNTTGLQGMANAFHKAPSTRYFWKCIVKRYWEGIGKALQGIAKGLFVLD